MSQIYFDKRIKTLSYLVLSMLLLLTIINDVYRISYVSQYLTGSKSVVSNPIGVQFGTSTINHIEKNAQESGLRVGDNIIAVNGIPYTGIGVLERVICYTRPGNILEIKVTSSAYNNKINYIRIPLAEKTRSHAERWYIVIFIFILFPLISQLLGFWAIATRPWNTVVWITLIFSIAFSQLIRINMEYSEGDLLSSFSLIYSKFFSRTWAAWLLLLAIYFPSRSAIDFRIRWAKWILILPICIIALSNLLIELTNKYNYALVANYTAIYVVLKLILYYMSVVSAALAIIMVIARKITDSSLDDGRRFRIFYSGTLLSILPILCLAIIGSYIGRDLGRFSAPILLPSLFMVFLFPITLAYAVVVRRAPELSVVMRQVVNVLLSPKGLLVFQVTSAILLITYLIFSSSQNELRVETKVVILFAIIYFILNILVSRHKFLSRFRSLVDWAFFKKAYRVENLLRDFENLIRRIHDAKKLLYTAEQQLSEAFSASPVSILFNTSNGLCLLNGQKTGYGEIMFSADSDLASKLSKNTYPKLLYFDQPDSWVHDIKGIEKIKLQALKSQVLIPLAGNDGLKGVISLGPKRFQSPYTDSELKILGIIGTQIGLSIENAELIEKVSAEVTASERIKAEKDAAEKANQAKSEFLASMSHELRTPLTAIIGYSEMLLEDATDRGDEVIITDLNKIHSAGKHLLEVINAVLDISKIEAGKMEIHIETFAIDEVVNNVVQIAHPLVHKNNNKLILNVNDDLKYIDSDRTKLRQGLFNLISNASKFTRDGSIILSVSRNSEDGKEWVSFTVSDTGIGMTGEQLEKLFKAFSQADSTVSSRYGGTGLGLYITKRFCDLLGGSISVESEQGKGSTFVIKLPSTQNESLSIEPEVEVSHTEDAAKILIIDDDPVVHEIIKRSLNNYNLHILSALNAESGFELAKKHAPRVIILDVIMKGADGWQLLSKLKSDPDVNPIPVIMLSIIDSKSAAYALGASDYLCKPIDRKQLTDALHRCFFQLENQENDKKVLIIDDEIESRKLLRRMLEGSGWNVTEAIGGAQALLELKTNIPNLIILDLLMPGMDGFTFAEEIRRNLDMASIPIIVVTSKDLTAADRNRLSGKVSMVFEKKPLFENSTMESLNKQVEMYLQSGKRETS